MYFAKENLDKNERSPTSRGSKDELLQTALLLIRSGSSANVQDKDGETPLHHAAAAGSHEYVSLLLAYGADVPLPNNAGYTPLHKACEGRHIGVAALLLDNLADIDAATQDGYTALHLACKGDDVELVKLLTSRGADTNTKAKNGHSPLHEASDNGNIEIMRILMSQGSDIEAVTTFGATPLHLSTEKGRMDASLALLDAGANIEARTLDGKTPLHCACVGAKNDMVSVLLAKNAQIDSQCQDEDTALHLASLHSDGSLVSILLHNSANLHLQNKIGETPLHAACRRGDLAISKLLLEHGADVKTKNNNGLTPLHYASMFGHFEVVDILVNAGAPVDDTDKFGDPALHPKPVKLESSHPYPNNMNEFIPVEILGALGYHISFDARTSTEPCGDGKGDYVTFYKDRSYKAYWGEEKYSGGLNDTRKNFPGIDGQPPLHIASQRFILHFFSETGVTDWGYKLTITPIFLLEDETKNGWTPLMWASYLGMKAAVDVLIRHKACIKNADWEGNTALSLAVQNFHQDAAISLVRAGARLDLKNKAKISPIEIAVQNNFNSFISAMLSIFDPFVDDSSDQFREGAVFVWEYILAQTEAFELEVRSVLSRFQSRLLVLAYSVDVWGRRTIDVARPVYKKIIMEYIFFYKRYDFDDSQRPEHKSATCTVILAKDHSDDNVVPVALKFMSDKNQFLRECYARTNGEFDDKYVVSIIRSHDSDTDAEFRNEIERKGLIPYCYCIVMPAAERNLSAILSHEHIAGRDWQQIRALSMDIVSAVAHVHSKNMIHANLKPFSILRVNGRFKLVDFHSSVDVKDGSYLTGDHSTAYVPPEMLMIKSHRRLTVRTPVETSDSDNDFSEHPSEDDRSSRQLLQANYSYDVWSLGVVFYHLFTGEPLFKANDEDNIDQENLWTLFHWTNEHKNECLLKVSNPIARNLLGRLLCKDPSRRPDTGHVLAHPFFTGQSPTRMIGEEAAFDVFLSYRSSTDFDIARAMYDLLTVMGLHVWWDKQCLEAGKKWEEGFCDGLVSSAVFIPLISKDAIFNQKVSTSNISSLKPDSEIDYVYLEHRYALELMDMGLIEAVYPVFIGETQDTGDYRNRNFSKFNEMKSFRSLPNCAVTAVEDHIKEHLERQGLGAPLNEDMTINDVYTKILSYQGGLLENRGEDAVIHLCNIVKQTVEKCNAIRLTQPSIVSKSETEVLKEEIIRLKNENSEKDKVISQLKVMIDQLVQDKEDNKDDNDDDDMTIITTLNNESNNNMTNLVNNNGANMTNDVTSMTNNVTHNVTNNVTKATNNSDASSTDSNLLPPVPGASRRASRVLSRKASASYSQIEKLQQQCSLLLEGLHKISYILDEMRNSPSSGTYSNINNNNNHHHNITMNNTNASTTESYVDKVRKVPSRTLSTLSSLSNFSFKSFGLKDYKPSFLSRKKDKRAQSMPNQISKLAEMEIQEARELRKSATVANIGGPSPRGLKRMERVRNLQVITEDSDVDDEGKSRRRSDSLVRPVTPSFFKDDITEGGGGGGGSDDDIGEEVPAYLPYFKSTSGWNSPTNSDLSTPSTPGEDILRSHSGTSYVTANMPPNDPIHRYLLSTVQEIRHKLAHTRISLDPSEGVLSSSTTKDSIPDDVNLDKKISAIPSVFNEIIPSSFRNDGEVLNIWVSSVSIILTLKQEKGENNLQRGRLSRQKSVLSHTDSMLGDRLRRGTLLSLDPLCSSLTWRGWGSGSDSRSDEWQRVHIFRDMEVNNLVSLDADNCSIDVKLSESECVIIQCVDMIQKDYWGKIMKEYIENFADQR